MGVYFDPGHTWVYLEESGVARVGITDFASDIIGTVDTAEPRTPGETVQQGEALLRLRRGDRSATFRSPIDGVVEKVNMAPVKNLNTDPSEEYVSSWIYKIQPKDTSIIPKVLMLGEAAKSWLDHEIERLTVFLATTAPTSSILGPTAHDGGLIAQGLIDSLSETDWEKLQEKFLSGSKAL
jgi:glycine cleavage system H protein